MAETTVTFLGTGTSHGIPVIGCDCRVCGSNDPRDKRLRTSIHLACETHSLVIDTTPDFRTQCLREGIRRVDSVFYTHSHVDHILGFDDLRRFCELEDKSIPVFGSERTLADLKRVFRYAFDGSARYRNYVRPDPFTIEGPFRLGRWDIVPVDLPHGRMTTTGFVFGSEGSRDFAYFTDCQALPAPAIEAARGVGTLVIDGLRHNAHSTHFTIQGAVEAARLLGARRTYLIHMCHDIGHAETEENLPPDIRLAHDGLRIDF